MMMAKPSAAVNMTDFSRSNNLPSAPPTTSHVDLVDALHNLRHFECTFYNESTEEVLNAAAMFIDAFGESSEPYSDTTRILTLWFDMKLCTFRGLVVSDGL
ncbi:hypothetical protein PI126_g14962 [Phytophthora idaei]|nr:hypothetical protein PI126_g14962 [Phytophthora idaei]